jgi:capsular exopolysaccharide synthesis family protein
MKGRFKKVSSIDQMVMDSKNSVAAEAYRILRTRILWSTANQDLKKNLIVSSCIPEEGKTTVASNLAITLSRLNIRVLLVDTDMRRGRIAESYQLPSDKGLANYLAENLDLEAVVQPTSIPGLSIVACGSSDIDSWQLFNAPQMKKFIAEAGQKFDQVIYDTAPLIVISDTLLLISIITGGVVLTTRSGVTNARLLKKALSMIREANANLSGVVLNDLTSTESRAYGNYNNAYQKRPKK